jgi:hypothetical protein
MSTTRRRRSTTWHSLTFGRIGSPRFHVLPASSLQIAWEPYTPSAVEWSHGTTRRPACGPLVSWMPTPGPVAYHRQSLRFASAVISSGLLQVAPSSADRLMNTRRLSWAVTFLIAA